MEATHFEDGDVGKDLLVAKVVSMVVLGTASLALGMLPTRLKKLVKVGGDKNLLVSLLLCYGGGVLLFTTFIHLQPEVRDSFRRSGLDEKVHILEHAGIPLSELVFCFGFFFVYMIEELVHAFLDRSHQDDAAALHRSLSVKCSGGNNVRNLTIPRVSLISGKLDDSTSNVTFTATGSTRELLQNHQHQVVFRENHPHQSYQSCASSDASQSSTSHAHRHVHSPPQHPFRGFLTVLALSFHAVFEGLAVGLEKSPSRTWYLFGAIATHKLVIAFCVGVELVAGGTRHLLVLVYVGTFALVTPLGIGLGIALGGTGAGAASNDAFAVVLQGMAAGTLLYVVFFEVLARERANGHSGLWQLLAILAGFGTMLGLQLITGHDHGSGEHDAGHHHDHTHLHGQQADLILGDSLHVH